jgi:outer membrane PBP1 activator LpoA protein
MGKENSMKRVVLVILAALVLAGCGDPTLEERVAYREKCEAAGGRYYEYHDGLTLRLTSACNLERPEVSP